MEELVPPQGSYSIKAKNDESKAQRQAYKVFALFSNNRRKAFDKGL
jgi:hypothetical protein